MTTPENTETIAEDMVNEVFNAHAEAENAVPEIESSPENELVAKTSAELAEMKDKFLRLQAEFDNFRKRTSKEKLELIGSAEERLIVSLLPVVDDIERATISMASATDVEVLKQGTELIFSKFKRTLESKGMKSLETKGTDFNPDLHEAITQIPAPTEDLKNKVVDEIEKGYYLNDKLIRVAKVVIGN